MRTLAPGGSQIPDTSPSATRSAGTVPATGVGVQACNNIPITVSNVEFLESDNAAAWQALTSAQNMLDALHPESWLLLLL